MSENLADLEAAKGNANGTEYIKGLLEVTAADAKNNILVASVELGAIVFLAKDSVADFRRADDTLQFVAMAAIGCLAISAALYFVYAAFINQIRMSIVRSLASADAQQARQLWASDSSGVQRRYGWLHYGAIALTLIGLLLAGLALKGLWDLPPAA